MKAEATATVEARLRLRLQSCLETILELKGELDTPATDVLFMQAEFDVMALFLEKLPDLYLTEGEVLRVEQATKKFLRELNSLVRMENQKQESLGAAYGHNL